MLQRAASNAYSWWWASHIRTKQSKWLEQSLQDMEEKVQYVLKLIEEDGDSFARRAEMYYKKRPELIHFVEESYRAYRALAERYDHISTELQNANTTIASVFPEQVQFAMDEEDEAAAPRFRNRPQEPLKMDIPKVPKSPARDLKVLLTTASKKLQQKKRAESVTSVNANAKSGLSKPEAIGKIDKLQKEILALQTEKEFVKSSYESAHGKYREIEKWIKERQEQICSLQDEFGVSMVIADDEARKLMTQAALKSCQETWDCLNEKHERSAEEARVESGRVKVVREKLESLKDEFSCNENNRESTRANAKDESVSIRKEQEPGGGAEERQDLELLRKKIKEHLEVGINGSLSVTELAEKVDEIVNKVINLETEVSSQNALIKRLRVETDELQAQIQTMEDDRATLSRGTNNISIKLRKMDEKLHGIQDLEKSIEDKGNNLQTHFIEARCNIDHLTELHSGKQVGSTMETKSEKKSEAHKAATTSSENFEKQKTVEPDVKVTETPRSRKSDEESEIKAASQTEAESPVEIKSEKYEVQEEAATNYSDSFEILQTAKPDGELKVTNSLEKEKGFKVEDRISLETEIVKPDDKLKVTGPLEKEEGFIVENRISSETEIVKPDDKLKVTGPLEELRVSEHKTLGELLHPGKTFEKARDVKTEVRKDSKEHDPQVQDKGNKQTITQKVDDLNAEQHEQGASEDKDEPNWRELFLNGLDSKEKLILNEYTTVLRNYKEVKKKLDEVEKKSQDSLFQTTVQLSELKSANVRKDDEIRSLRQNLSLLQTSFDGDKDMNETKATNVIYISYSLNCNGENPPTGKEGNIEEISVDQPPIMSEVEEKFRSNIDELLEENLDFWLRFSTSFHEIQKFQTEVEDLQAEISKLDIENKKNEGSTSRRHALRSDVRPLYKHLREIETELTVSMEQSALLKQELQSRFTSLCNIQEEITKALKESAEDDNFTFTSYQAAKFQGEVLNMKQENNKVADELQAALDHVTTLQIEIDKTLGKLNEEFGLSGSKNSHQNQQLKHSESRSRVPLRSFIFGVKQKSQKPSFFSCVTPALQRKYRGLRAGASNT